MAASSSLLTFNNEVSIVKEPASSSQQRAANTSCSVGALSAYLASCNLARAAPTFWGVAIRCQKGALGRELRANRFGSLKRLIRMAVRASWLKLGCFQLSSRACTCLFLIHVLQGFQGVPMPQVWNQYFQHCIVSGSHFQSGSSIELMVYLGVTPSSSRGWAPVLNAVALNGRASFGEVFDKAVP